MAEISAVNNTMECDLQIFNKNILYLEVAGSKFMHL